MLTKNSRKKDATMIQIEALKKRASKLEKQWIAMSRTLRQLLKKVGPLAISAAVLLPLSARADIEYRCDSPSNELIFSNKVDGACWPRESKRTVRNFWREQYQKEARLGSMTPRQAKKEEAIEVTRYRCRVVDVAIVEVAQ